MKKRSNRTGISNTSKLIELGVASPQVIVHRSARLVKAGANPSKRDRKEFIGMIVEKQIGFTQAWLAMCTELMLAQPRMLMAILSSRPDQLLEIYGAVLSKGLAPIHSKAVSNSKRLARTPV